MWLNEISLCPVAVESGSFATSVQPQHVKCLANGAYIPVEQYHEYKSLTTERDGLEWLRDRLTADEHRAQDLEAIELAVARATLGIRSRS